MDPDRSTGLRGRQPVKPPRERLAISYLHHYLLSPLTGPSYPVDVSGGISDWQMLGNGPDPTLTVNGGRPVGDCTFAARQHLRMAKAAAGGLVETWESSDALVTEYLAYDRGVDRGANIAEVLTYWFLTGKIRAFAPVDHTDPAGCDSVMAAFHGLYVGVDLTDAANSQFSAGEIWTVENGERPDPTDGHCIVKVKADGQNIDTWVTWGTMQQSTRQWTSACIQEAWAVITTEDEANKIDISGLVTDITSAIKSSTHDPDHTSDRNTAAVSFALGWQMAQLYRPFKEEVGGAPLDHLPSLREYDSDARLELAFEQVDSLLQQAGLPDVDSDGLVQPWRTSDWELRRLHLLGLHYRVLDTLVCDDPSQAASYQLGRALNDACWLPDTEHDLAAGRRRVDVFFDQFGRDRMATLNGWLGQMGALAPQAVPVVTRSLQNWSDWVDANTEMLERNWEGCEAPIVAALRNQSAGWYGLLSSEKVSVQAPMGAWMHAGEAIVRNSRATIGHVLRWFWPVLVVILAAMGGLIYLAVDNASGTAKVWTAMVTVGAGLAATGAGLRTGATRVASGLEQTVYQSATLDAEGWSVTWLPNIRLSRISRHRLRKSGVAPPASGVRLDRLRRSRRA